MKKTLFSKIMLLVTLVLFLANFTPVIAQVMEIEVIGGGYRLRGPDVIEFGSVAASFSTVQSEKDIRDLDSQNEEDVSNTEALDYLAVEDQNGGNPFQVTISATDFSSGANSFSGSALEVKNANGDGDTNDDIISENAQTSKLGVTLPSSSANFTNLGTQKTLFTSEGRAPGIWRIFPVFRINVPSGTPPGTYNSTITFTII